MKKLGFLLQFVVLLAVNGEVASASPPIQMDIVKLLHGSSVILIGQVVRREELTPGHPNSPAFTIAVSRVVWGASVDSRLDVYPPESKGLFDGLPDPPIGQNEFGLFFLRQMQDKKFSFTEAAYPDLPAPRGWPAIKGLDSSESAAIAAVLASEFVDPRADGSNLPSQRVFHTFAPIPGDSVYNALFRVLSLLPKDVVIPTLTTALSRCRDPIARGWVVASLLNHGSTHGLDSVVWFTTHPGLQKNFPREAIEGELGSAILDDPDVSAIIGVLGSPDPNMRIAAAAALREIDTREAVLALAGVVRDPVEEVRYHAVSGICRVTRACGSVGIRGLSQPSNYSAIMAIVKDWSRSSEE